MSVIALEYRTKQDVYKHFIRYIKGLKGSYHIVYFTTYHFQDFDLSEVLQSPELEGILPPMGPFPLESVVSDPFTPKQSFHWTSKSNSEQRSISVYFSMSYLAGAGYRGVCGDLVFADWNLPEEIRVSIVWPSIAFGRRDLYLFWQKGRKVWRGYVFYNSVLASFKKSVRVLLLHGCTLKNSPLSMLPLEVIQTVCKAF